MYAGCLLADDPKDFGGPSWPIFMFMMHRSAYIEFVYPITVKAILLLCLKHLFGEIGLISE